MRYPRSLTEALRKPQAGCAAYSSLSFSDVEPFVAIIGCAAHRWCSRGSATRLQIGGSACLFYRWCFVVVTNLRELIIFKWRERRVLTAYKDWDLPRSETHMKGEDMNLRTFGKLDMYPCQVVILCLSNPARIYLSRKCQVWPDAYLQKKNLVRYYVNSMWKNYTLLTIWSGQFFSKKDISYESWASFFQYLQHNSSGRGNTFPIRALLMIYTWISPSSELYLKVSGISCAIISIETLFNQKV